MSRTNHSPVGEKSEKKKHLPDVYSDHVFSVGLLDHVVDGVAARKCYVDVVSCDNI